MIPRELRTERLLLRQWREADAEALGEIYAQPEFLEHMPQLGLTHRGEAHWRGHEHVWYALDC